MRHLFFTTVIALFTLILTAPAFAINPNPPNPCGNHGNNCGPDDESGGSNTNTNTAFGGSVQVERGAFDVDLTNKQKQQQGQAQLQGQKQTAVGKVDVDQDQHQRVEDNSFVDASDHSTQTIDNDFPVNTAAPVFAGNCAQGVSAQTGPFGGSVATGNSVCDFIAIAGAYVASGDPVESLRLLRKAEKAADNRFLFSRIRSILTLGLL